GLLGRVVDAIVLGAGERGQQCKQNEQSADPARGAGCDGERARCWLCHDPVSPATRRTLYERCNVASREDSSSGEAGELEENRRAGGEREERNHETHGRHESGRRGEGQYWSARWLLT